MIQNPLPPDVLEDLGAKMPGGIMALVHPTRPYGGRPAREALKTSPPEAVAELLSKTPYLLRKPLLTDGQQALAGFDPDAYGAFFAR